MNIINTYRLNCITAWWVFRLRVPFYQEYTLQYINRNNINNKNNNRSPSSSPSSPWPFSHKYPNSAKQSFSSKTIPNHSDKKSLQNIPSQISFYGILFLVLLIKPVSNIYTLLCIRMAQLLRWNNVSLLWWGIMGMGMGDWVWGNFGIFLNLRNWQWLMKLSK